MNGLEQNVILNTNTIHKRHSIKVTKKTINTLKKEIIQYFDSNGYLSYSTKRKKYTILGTNSPKDGLVDCPQCKVGKLLVIRSPKTKKRFMGCSNYNNGCTASSPLLQKARLRATRKACKQCHWPIVIFRYSNKQCWTQQCSNIKCKTRRSIVSKG